MAEQLALFDKLAAAEEISDCGLSESRNYELDQKIIDHRAWLKSIRREKPSPKQPFRVGIYIRYFNQTKYENYLEYHIKQYQDTMAMCPNWKLIDFYVDEGSATPNMENAPEWCRLLQDCFCGKVNLIITQKVSNVTKKHYEITMLSRILAAQAVPVGIYFVSEDIYTLASYYRNDCRDTEFFPSKDWQILPDGEEEQQLLTRGGTDD